MTMHSTAGGHQRIPALTTSPWQVRARALLLTVSVALLGACGGTPPTTAELEQQAFDDLREEVRQTIEDVDREIAAVKVVDELQHEFTSLRKVAEERRRQLRALNADYDATREQFTGLLAKFATQREASHRRFQEVRAELEASVTAEEWADLERTNTRAMASLARLIAAI